MTDRADELHEEGVALADAGDKEGALAKYMAALAIDMNRANTLYNVGLYYKYHGAWTESLRYNRRSVDVRPDNDAANWNLAIAATALGDWATARDVWHRLKILKERGEGPLVGNWGSTPVRLNGLEMGEAAVEVVWARRLSPVHARLDNIPTGETGFRFGDVVLHDGAANGYRLDHNQTECPVFDVFQLLERSEFSTYEAIVVAPDEAVVDVLASKLKDAEFEFEDWTASLQILCKACSEGRPHEQHDHGSESTEWQPERRIGIAIQPQQTRQLTVLLQRWARWRKGCELLSVECVCE